MRETLIKIGAGIVIGILIFFSFKSCDTKTSTSDIEKVHIRDTITKTKIDTFRDTVKIVRKSEPDTIIKEIRPDKDYHTVHSKYKDSLLEAKVSTDLKGEFLSQELNYTLKSPREKIVRTDSVFIKDSTYVKETVTKNPWRIGFGMEVEGSRTYFDFAPAISLEKDGVQFKYEYNVLNKTHEIGIQKKINLNNF
jgi:hypothetical protein